MTEEAFRGWWHYAIGVVFGATACYNLMRLSAGGGHRNAVNAVIFVTLAAYEGSNVRAHWRHP